MSENFHLILNVIVYFLDFGAIICMMFVLTTDQRYFEMITNIFENWEKGPIQDIIVINSTERDSCVENYEYLTEYTWPGTKVGCNCINMINYANSHNQTIPNSFLEFSGKIIIGSCPLSLLDLGCEEIDEVKEKKINSIGEKIFCVRRFNFSYLNNYDSNIISHSQNKCTNNFANCGVVDSVNNILCYNDTVCPLKPQLDDNTTNFHLLTINDEDKIEHIVKFYSQFYTDFQLSQGNVCIYNSEVNTFIENLYELFNEKKHMKCSTRIIENIKYDFRYTPLLAIKTSNLFRKNSKLFNEIKSLPSFPLQFFEYPIYLFGRKYVGWHKKCRKDLSQFQKINLISKKLQKYPMFYLIYSLFILIYCMLFIMILKELLHEQFLFKIGIIVFHMILILIIFSMVINDYFEIFEGIEISLSIVKKRCSDKETNFLVVMVLEILENISKLYMITIILYVTMLLLSLFKISLTVYKIYKRALLRRIMDGRMNEFEMMLIV